MSSETRSVCIMQALNTCRWLVNALVTWHVSYKITTLPLLYFVWTEEHYQTSLNKNKSPNLLHVTSILVCCIFGCVPLPFMAVGTASKLHKSVFPWYFIWWYFSDFKQSLIYNVKLRKVAWLVSRTPITFAKIWFPKVIKTLRNVWHIKRDLTYFSASSWV